jgi:hypothetical protein
MTLAVLVDYFDVRDVRMGGTGVRRTGVESDARRHPGERAGTPGEQ